MKKLLLASLLILAMLLALAPAAFAEDGYAVVTFHSNGGWFGDDTENIELPVEYEHGSVLYCCDSYHYLGLNSASHVALSGWYYDAACTQPAFAWDESYTVSDDVDLYAGWTDGYDVTLDAGGGQFPDGKTSKTYCIMTGSPMIGEYDVPSDPQRGTPEYWQLADGTPVNLEEFVPTGDVTLYAKYFSGYYVTFDANGGYFWSEDNLSITVPYRDSQAVGGSDYVPVSFDSHMAFTGWYYDPDCTQPALDMNETISATQDMM